MALWPALVPAVAAHGLPGATQALPERPLEPAVWAHLMEIARYERITGLLVSAILDGALPATVEQIEEAKLAHRTFMVTALALEAALVRTVTLLEGTGIDHRVLKGSGVAHLDYPDPALRSFGDVDLLVRSSQYDDAVKALVAIGHQRKFPEPRPGFDRRFGKGSCLVGPDGHEIDVHRTLAMGPYGIGVDLDDLWRRSSTFELAGRLFRALGPEERFLHACFHAVLGDNPPRLASLRDVAQMHLARPIDVDLVRHLSSSWGADAVVARAVRLASDVLASERAGPLTAWATEFSPGRRDRQFLAVYSKASRSYAAKSFAAVRAIPGMRDKAAFVVSLALPTRSYLEQRRQRASQRWLRGLIEVRRARRLR
jgi:putative nucleotidyltransferase-like protein